MTVRNKQTKNKWLIKVGRLLTDSSLGGWVTAPSEEVLG